MHIVIQVIHVILSILLVVLILLQNEGSGLGSAFGGGEVYHTKRGFEKALFFFTVLVAVGFTLTSVGNIILS